MRSLITGIAGFAGKHLAEYLSSQGCEVGGIDIGPPPYHPATRIYSVNILDFESVAKVLAEFNPEAVYHLAGLANPAPSLARPRDYFQVNTLGTVNILEAVRLHSPEAQLLLVSSSTVYGKLPLDLELVGEDQVPDPVDPYAASKFLAELAGRQYFRNYGLQVIIARPFNHTGPGQTTGYVVPDFCRQIALFESQPDGGPGEIRTGSLSGVRDFLDVRDVVRAYRSLVESGIPGEIYNIASGQGYSIRQILAMALDSTRSRFKIVSQSSAEEARQAERLVGDNRKLRAATSWRPQINLEETIGATLEFWRQRIASEKRS